MNQQFPEITVTANDRQVGADHYKTMPMQPWEVMEAVLTPEEFRGFLKGNIVKYAMRAGRKEGSDDAGKARHYKQKLAEVAALKMPRKPEDFGTCGNVDMEASE